MKTLRHLVIVGRIGVDESGKERGKMAQALCQGCFSKGILHTLIADASFPSDLPEETVVAFTSKAPRFPSVLVECEKRRLPLAVVSSNIVIPSSVKTPVFSGPNLGLVTVAVLGIFPRLSVLVKSLGAKSWVAEFHQSGKPSGSATAHEFAQMLGIPKEQVGSGRSDALAKVFLDVPDAYIDGFARIGIIIGACGVTLRMSLETNGRAAYFEGLMAVIAKYYECENAIGPGVWPVDRLMFGDIN